MVGKTLSHYRILEEVGRGGMGIVYKAEDVNLNRLVALKVLPPQQVSEEDRERFRREAQAAAALNHPNIATIHDFGETDEGRTFIVMELVEGQSLTDKIRDGSLDEETVIDIVRQMTEGLGAAHSRGVVHRDIKPGNTMLTQDGRVKILDFGLAKLSEGVDITKTGTTFGTIAYMSPEQVQGQDIDGRSDLWSLGVVFYEMLTGEKPFSGAYEAAVIYSIVNQTVDLENDRIPESLRPILGRLLVRDREQRFESARELVDALNGGAVSPAGSVGSISTRWLPQARQRVLRALALGAAGIAVAVIVVWIAWRADVFSQGPTAVAGANQPTVAVMYIQNDTPRERLGFTLRDMLSRNLVRVEQIHTVYNERLKDILRLEIGEDPETVDNATATRIARQAGISLMITGSVVQLGPEFIVEVDLVDVESGDVLAAESAAAVSASGIMDAVNQLTSGILRAIGGLGDDVDGPLLIQDVSTSFLSAYELFERGRNEEEHWRFDEALEYYKSAISVDSTFVAAYIEATLASSVFGFDPRDDLAEPRRYLQMARRQETRSTPKEKAILEVLGRLLEFSEGTDTGGDFRKLADDYPDDKQLQLLAANYSDEETSFRYLNRVFELDPAYADGYNLMAYNKVLAGQPEEAVSMIRRYPALQPNNPNTMDSAWEVMVGAGEEAESIQMLNRLLDEHPEWQRQVDWRKAYSKAISSDTSGIAMLLKTYADNERIQGSVGRDVYLALGQWALAAEWSARALEASRASNPDGVPPGHLRNHAAVLHANGLHAEAERLLDEAVVVSRKFFTDEFNPYPVLAAYQNGLGYADAGNRPGLVAAIEKVDEALKAPGIDGRHRAYRHLLSAHLALMDGDLDTASENIARLHDSVTWSSHWFRLTARLAGMRGDTEYALFRFHLVQHFVASKGFGISAYPSFFIDHAVAPYEIAKMFDDLGDTEEAIRRFQTALSQWESAGADFRYVDKVRDRLQELR